MTALTTFNFDGAEVRTVRLGESVWFIAADVAKILGYRMASDLTRSLESEDKGTHETRTANGTQEVTIISEPGLYQAILQRQTGRMTDLHMKEKVRRFKQWVTGEVLPSIRKTGSYGTPTVPDLTALTPDVVEYLGHISQALTLAVKTAQVNKEKADGFDAFLNGEGHYLIGTVARMLGVGQQTFFNWLYAERILIKGGPRHRQPYADRADWFEVFAHDTAYTNGKAATTTYFTPAGAEKCRQYLTKRGYLKPQLLELTTGALT